MNIHILDVYFALVWKKTCYGTKIDQNLKNWQVHEKKTMVLQVVSYTGIITCVL